MKRKIFKALSFFLVLVLMCSGVPASYAQQSDEGWMWPVPQNLTIFSPYGPRTLDGKPDLHKGIDISYVAGYTVVATRTGVVVGVNNNATYQWDKANYGAGCFVTLKHSVNGVTYYSSYCHMVSGSAIKDDGTKIEVGMTIRQGEKIGVTGKTGNAGGTHLHFQISTTINDKAVAQSTTAINTNPYDNSYIKSNNLGTYSNADICNSTSSGIKYIISPSNIDVAIEKPLPSLTPIVITSSATNITETNAELVGSVSKQSGQNITRCGYQLGTSMSNMPEVVSFPCGSGTNNYQSGKGFNITCDMNSEAKTEYKNLLPGTTYFYRCYAYYNGEPIYGEIKSFTTKGSMIHGPMPTAIVTTGKAFDITTSGVSIDISISNLGQQKMESAWCEIYKNGQKVATLGSVPINDSEKSWGFCFNSENNLIAGTSYTYRCFAKVDGKTISGELMNFTTKGENKSNPVVTTSSTNGITQTNAIIYGSVAKQNGQNITESGFYLGASSGSLSRLVTFPESSAANSKGDGTGFDIWCDINAEAGMTLSPGATYYYQCYVVYNGTEYRGTTKNFTTSPATPAPVVAPIVTTADTRGISQTNATIYGSVFKQNGQNITGSGFYLGTSSGSLSKIVTFPESSAANSKGGGTGFDIWCDINAEAGMTLSAGTTYYYQCYVVYNGTEYRGTTKNFTTSPATPASVAAPTVTTADTRGISQTNATIYGSVAKQNGQNITGSGFYLGTSSGSLSKIVTFPESSAANGKGGGTGFDIWCDINAEAGKTLSPGTIYYYQCYVVYNGTEYRGTTRSFTTSPATAVAPSVSPYTSSTKNITKSNAVIQGGVEKTSGQYISASGFYFGTSTGNMQKIVSFPGDQASNNYRNGTGFDIWCDLNAEAGITLSSGTTYYYQCYVVYDGVEYRGNVHNFKTA